MKLSHVVYSMILDDTGSKILMVRNKDNGQWTLPGGSVEPGESLDQAAIREVMEETGYTIQVCGVMAVNEAKLQKLREHIVFITFRAEIVGGQEDITLPDEIAEISWIDLDQADQLMPYFKEGISTIIRKGVEVTYYDEGLILE